MGTVSNSQANEAALRPYVRSLTLKCFALAHLSQNAGPNYYYVLRGLFRVITTAKLEYCFHALVPILPAIMQSIQSLYARTTNNLNKTHLLELGLVLPARFLPPLPLLPVLLTFIAEALYTGDGELPQLALRTFEYWLENVNPAYLCRCMDNIPWPSAKDHQPSDSTSAPHACSVWSSGTACSWKNSVCIPQQ